MLHPKIVLLAGLMLPPIGSSRLESRRSEGCSGWVLCLAGSPCSQLEWKRPAERHRRHLRHRRLDRGFLLHEQQ